MKRIRVLIIDDSALAREVLRQLLASAPDIEVVGAAADPVRGAELLAQLSPDVVTLDVEMPRMNGLTFLERIMRERPVPVVMVSSMTEKGSQLALKALELGAVEVVEKPKLDIRTGTFAIADELLSKVRAAACARPRINTARSRASAPAEQRIRTLNGVVATSDKLVVIGASTGGTEALSAVLGALPHDAPPVLVVQHMPAHFLVSFAERLDRSGRVHVKIARSGDRLQTGSVLLAPGGMHMQVARSGGQLRVNLTAEPATGLHKPSIGVLFDSVAAITGKTAIAVLLTGMGADGADGMLHIRRAGGHTIAQNEETCVVFGMPKEAIARGGATEVLALDRIASAITRAARS
jgi:two-component system chemotaxis response regulator CheB